MFAYPCPFCGHRLLATAERTGQRTICSKCLKPIVIPAPDAPAPVGRRDDPLDDVAADSLHGPDDSDGPELTVPLVEAPPEIGISETPPPMPMPKRVVRPAPVAPFVPTPRAPRTEAAGMVMFAPTGMESVDVAAELTAALTMRMKPPPEPPSDLKLSTGLWLTLTAIGLSLWVFSLVYSEEARVYTALLGGVELVIGYAWVAYIAGRRGVAEGAMALVPPVAFAKMFRPTSSTGYRPARFAVSGLVLLVLFAIAPWARPVVRLAVGMNDDAPPLLAPIDDSPAARLRDAAGQPNDQVLADVLRDLIARKAELRTSTRPPQKAQLIDELRAALKSDRDDAKPLALAALVGWADDAAKPDVLAALKSTNPRERRAALELCSRWKDPAVVKAVLGVLTVPDERNAVGRALRELARDRNEAMIEDALLPMLTDDRSEVAGSIRTLSEEYGGDRTIAELERLRAATPRPGLRKTYQEWIANVKRSKDARS